MRTYRPERIKMSDYADLEMHGERLVEMKPVLNESVWKAAVEANIIDEAKAVRDGLLEIRRAARSKHFKRAKRRTGEKNGRNK